MTRTSSPVCLACAAACLTVALSILGVPGSALAESDVIAGASTDPGLDATTSERKIDSHWTLGAGASMSPTFEGSDEYELNPIPLVDLKYGRFFAKAGDGIGVNIVETRRFTAGASVDWMQGYDGDDVGSGIDDVDGALGARIFGAARLGGVVASIAATQAVSETDRGLIVDATLSYPIHASERFTLAPSVGTTWANEKYMTGYFGVDSAEAAASGLRRYDAKSGLKDVSFRISGKYRITRSISAIGSVGVSHLLGEAADSPIVEQETTPTGLLGIAYTF